jgi:hypothetical protein
MRSGTGKPGQGLASIGGLGLALSLWLPWYTIHISQSALNSVAQMSQQLGALGPLVRTGAQLISQLGPFHVNAWQAFHSATPAVVLAVAVIGGGLGLLALSDRAGAASQPTMLAGGVAVLLVGYKIAVPPTQSGFVHPAWGIYLALLSAVAMVVGGALSTRDGDTYEPERVTSRPTPYQPASAPTSWGAAEPAAAAALSVAVEPTTVFADPVTGLGDTRSSTDSVAPPSL